MTGKTTPEEQKLLDEQRALYTENVRLTSRLNMARAMVGMYIKGYAALLLHGVDMRKLPEYQDDATLDRAYELGAAAGTAGERVIEYCKRVCNAVDAAVKRKNLHPVK